MEWTPPHLHLYGGVARARKLNILPGSTEVRTLRAFRFHRRLALPAKMDAFS